MCKTKQTPNGQDAYESQDSMAPILMARLCDHYAALLDLEDSFFEYRRNQFDRVARRNSRKDNDSLK
jgi:hypothetical protein